MKNFYVFILLGCIFSCSSSEDAPNGGIPAEPLVYTIADISGLAFNVSISSDVTIPNDYGSSYSYQPQQASGSASLENINYSASLFPTFNDVLPHVGVGFNRFIIEQNRDCYEEQNYFEELFPVASYGYSTGEYNYGVVVDYATNSDGSGTYYTSYGPQDSSASFQVTAIETFNCGGLNKCMFLTGTFSCKLYNQLDANDTVDVTNGTFKLSFKSYNP